jgi:hypothetical protein
LGFELVAIFLVAIDEDDNMVITREPTGIGFQQEWNFLEQLLFATKITNFPVHSQWQNFWQENFQHGFGGILFKKEINVHQPVSNLTVLAYSVGTMVKPIVVAPGYL